MTKLSGKFYVATWEKKILIQVEGYATRHNSFLFREFIDCSLQDGFTDFVIDLSLCKEMDSTFMGVLVGIVTCNKYEKDPSVILINTTDYHRSLLATLGLTEVLCIKKDPVALPSLDLETLQCRGYSFQEQMAMVVQAHKNLAGINSKNEKIFQEFIEMVTKETYEE
jgi:anti-anti-sigma regulatory factor